MDHIQSVAVPEGYLKFVGRFSLTMGHLEAIAHSVAQALGVVDPALLSVSAALHRAHLQARFEMPPWSRAGVDDVLIWIDDVLELLPERNRMIHWAVTDWVWGCGDVDDIPEQAELVLFSPHELDFIPTGNAHVRELIGRAERLLASGESLYESLCCQTEGLGLIDPMASPDGVGSGEVGFHFGIDVDAWARLDQRKGGKERRR